MASILDGLVGQDEGFTAKDLTALGLGLMAAGGASPTPTGFGQALGMGFKNLKAERDARRDKAMQEALFGLKLGEAQRQSEKDSRETAEYNQKVGSRNATVAYAQKLASEGKIPPEQAEFLVANPDAAGEWFRDWAKPKDPQIAGGMQRDPKTGAWSPIPGWAEQAQASRPQTILQMPPAERAQQAKIGNYYGDTFAGLQESARSANDMNARLAQFVELQKQVNTNPLAPLTTQIKAAAKGLGIDLEAAGFRDDVAPAEAMRGASNLITLKLRTLEQMPASGFSDADRSFLQAIPPDLARSPQGNALIVAAMRKINQRQIEIAALARRYAQAHGGMLDPGFEDELQRWAEAHPLFTATDMPNGPAIGPRGVTGSTVQTIGGAVTFTAE